MFKNYLALLALSCIRSNPVASNDSVEFRISENLDLKSSDGFAVFGDKAKFLVAVKDAKLKDYEFSYGGKDVKLMAKDDVQGEFEGEITPESKLEYKHQEKGAGSVSLVDDVHTLLSLKSASSSQVLEDGVWKVDFVADCKQRKEIFGDWLIENSVIAENKNYCDGLKHDYKVENDTPVLGLSFQHGNHKEMVETSVDLSGLFSGFKNILIMAVIALVLIIALFWACCCKGACCIFSLCKRRKI
ncbi:hypothetical protein ROZALSC1DRAFT_28900 [Rozella allomycis CSF55]|uniref:Uncharacterized protein n=1 Tax=Rozella allomycis (strain CSF55) TaxID=988480 RepID=A0A075ASX2_ROZAC|nr:hypothetical protein O9G_003229 [Rozella allomycis CSF55]RKP19518.1 hypothetical protein ROZALSC1DRAFT_28900 [Rozella allomycis CSF55]|eukprot:EPZ33368.1 hypothetical protein O9G_003229 [Rozella allomycis CSF55]